MPSSSSVAHTSAGARSANRSLCSASRIACRSAGASARGWTPPGMRDRLRPRRRRAGPVPAVVAGLRRTHRGARRPGAGPRRQRGDRVVGHGVRPRLGVLALGERLQERLQFCLHIHHEAGLGQLLLQPRLLLAQPRRSARPADRAAGRPRGRASAGQRPGVAGPPPLHDVAGIQALPAQDRALLTRLRRVIGGQDLQLVLRGELRRRARSGTSGSGRSGSPSATCPASAATSRAVEGHRHVRDVSIPALGVSNSRGAGASGQLGREGPAEDPA